MKKFQKIRCGRSVAEQRYIHAKCAIFYRLPESERKKIRMLAAKIAEERRVYDEGRALLAVLLGECTPEQATARYEVPTGKIYAMQRDFYTRYKL